MASARPFSQSKTAELTAARCRLLPVAVAAFVLATVPSVGGQDANRGVRNVGVDEQPPITLGTLRALVIGIDGYTIWPTLRFAERDASDLRDILVEQYAFDPVNVSMLVGSEATESNVLLRLRKEIESSGPGDNLLIYYAGHGQHDPFTDTGYWIPVNGDLADESTWVSFTMVKALLSASAVKARSVLVITDSCWGGALATATRSGPDPITPDDQGYQERLRTLATRKSRQVMASGGFEEVPDESEFARLLKTALRENEHPVVDMAFLFFDRVYLNLRKMGLEPVLAPLTSRPGEDGQFVLVKRDSGGVASPVRARLVEGAGTK